ncbi:thiamine pyrophosphate-dependent acetolactate synthase large subunit-like protein [Georgenia soli]|uniref:Thiamine pyrophosphate-dependent acetolactate synthase large subunit-like protein n=1 Tax=Georgenia soli TaxID=638953 RepID=A0A2A9EGA7_9MICO|nr:thiamine pyrophosphate-binding protein [Georgenia soli]PFG38097.1 thiamine pyrophosphate-dependent acetolactate synthase large subunit-like protein [Georgenia soli]
MRVSEAVGAALVQLGVDHVFGVVGSGNFHVTNAMVAAGARFVAARHEGGAATMADAYARTSGSPAALSVHQGCGLTNAMTGIAEAAKSRTPLVVLAPEATSPTSNFAVDQDALARAVGAVPARVTSAATAVAETVAAVATAVHGRRTVVLNLPLDVQDEETTAHQPVRLPDAPAPRAPDREAVARFADVLRTARRPVFVAGRGARSARARDAVAALAARCGGLLATSAVAKGLFHDDAWSLDVSGGFSTPAAADLVRGADLVVGWGCALNMWTLRHGRLLGESAVVVQVDDTAEALGRHRAVDLGVLGDVRTTAEAVLAALGKGIAGEVGPGGAVGYRTEEVRRRLATEGRWRDVPVEEGDGGEETRVAQPGEAGERIDPRVLTAALDDLLPAERVVAVDSGNFMGYPSMYLSVPDEQGFCFTQAFQSIGLGLATAVGAALARPDRLPVAALGDGGALMGAAELDTVRRLGLPMVVLVYNDDAYGAEVHHFAGSGEPMDTVTFPSTDIAAVGRGYGFTSVTVRSLADLTGVQDWLAGPRSTPLLIDAKVRGDQPSWWLEEAFGH